MDRLGAMALLLEVVERGSFSAAGRALRMPVPTVSRKLSDLEAQLGARLLVRTTRKLSLTDAGEAYVQAARRILEQVEEAERAAAGEYQEPKGELILTAPVMFGRLHVLPLVSRFLARHPEIRVRLLLADRNVHLVDEHVDMAVRIGPLPISSLVATRVGTLRRVVCGSPRLIAQVGLPRVPDDLQHLPCITMEAAELLASRWHFRDPATGATQQVPISPRLSVTSADAARAAALDDVGFTRLLEYQAVDSDLEAVLTDYEPEPVPVHLMHAARGRMPLKLRRFLDFAGPELRGALGAGVTTPPAAS